MTATDKLRELLDERGVDYAWDRASIYWNSFDGVPWTAGRKHDGNLGLYCPCCTPEQAVAATLGHEQRSESVWESDPKWEQWLDGLKHDEIKTIGDAVQQLMYESIEHGGDMGPNGNTYGGVDEGEVLTLGFINDWIDKFDALLGCGTCEIYRVGNTRDIRKCSACGKQMHFDHPLDRDCLHYCPNCGAKVVD